MPVLFFFLIWFSVLGLGYWYVGRKLIRPANLGTKGRLRVWLCMLVFFLLPLLSFLLFINRVEGEWMDVFLWSGYATLGFFSLVLTGVFLRDITLLLRKVVDRIGGLITHEQIPSPPDQERRRFLLHSTNLGILGLSAVATGYGLYESYRRATIEEIEIPLPHLPTEFDGFRIAQFSDIHIGPTIKRAFAERVVEQVNDLHADLIAFTGDLVDGSVPWLRDDVAPLRALKARHGLYFVTGNHEYYSGVHEWVKEAGKLGFDVLMNEHRLIERNGSQIVVAGVTDYGAHDFVPDQKSDPAAALRNAPVDAVKILLAHQPRSITAAAQAGTDIQLSGHTHGGQFFPWNHFATLAQPYIKGLHKHGNTWVYVNRGTGYWGPPLRLGIPPEITLIKLVKV
ncbi:MAG: metallophosphoesterase [Bacteroidota bacterium]